MGFEFARPGCRRSSATTGADFAIYDMEHSGLLARDDPHLLALRRAVALTPMTRVPAIDQQFIAHALDVGTLGVMVPNVENGRAGAAWSSTR